MTRRNTAEDFDKCYIPEPMSGCFLWEKHSPNGRYGAMKWRGKRTQAHVIAYEINGGVVPEGHVVDHLCRNTWCVNPNHLEAVTQHVNMQRSAPATKTHCKHGHPYADGMEIYIRNDIHGKQYRRCLTCYALKYPNTSKGR